MYPYNNPIKNKARSKAIENAVKALTVNRVTSTLIRKSYVRDVKEFFNKSENNADKKYANKLLDSTISRWEDFYESIIQERNPNNLKVAYLSGPNPENDLQAFCDAGVLPENIWAFESDNKVYSEAVVSALNSNFNYIKIINGGLDSFLKESPQKFDIIYLDFCGPLPSRNTKQKTLTALTRILSKHSINSPGVLITNFSLPSEEQDPNGRMLFSKLVSSYLYPKGFLENSDGNRNIKEGAMAHCYTLEDWFEEVSDNLEYYYSQFVTRLLIDHVNIISPYNRFLNKPYMFNKIYDVKNNNDFKKKINKFLYDEEDSEVGTDPYMYSILWTFLLFNKKINNQSNNYPDFIFKDQEFLKFSKKFLSEFDINNDVKNLIKSVSYISYLLYDHGVDNNNYLSEKFKSFLDKTFINGYYQFCDLVLGNQFMELAFRQIANPYQVNVEKSLRWQYKAKETTMFMDMLILDECRYLYDWMPTFDMFPDAFNDIERQLVYRFVLDGVGKHTRWYNPECFYGTAVISQHEKGFEANYLLPRKNIL